MLSNGHASHPATWAAAGSESPVEDWREASLNLPGINQSRVEHKRAKRRPRSLRLNAQSGHCSLPQLRYIRPQPSIAAQSSIPNLSWPTIINKLDHTSTICTLRRGEETERVTCRWRYLIINLHRYHSTADLHAFKFFATWEVCNRIILSHHRKVCTASQPAENIASIESSDMVETRVIVKLSQNQRSAKVGTWNLTCPCRQVYLVLLEAATNQASY